MTSPTGDRVIVFDTTLRDGEQSPGGSMDKGQKLQLAVALRDLGVDVIELGFPVASVGDFEAVRDVAREVEGPIMCGLARATRGDIDRTLQALEDAPRRRVHVFLATSPLHRQYKLNLSKEEVVRRAIEAVAYARERFDDVQFSCEDAARTEPDFLAEVVERVIEAGATTINIPDTVGYATPQQMGQTIAALRATVRGVDKAVLSVHCHDDLGLAVANSLAALHAGARQVECTINGIGERAGNCSLEEVVMALRTRHDVFGLKTGIKTPRLYPTSRILSSITGLEIARNKAIVGQNAFAHESGIHQHGMLMNAATYEIMRPEDVGVASTSLVLGKHSGRHLLRQKVEALGYRLEPAQLDELFDDVKALADRKKEVFDADLEGLIQGILQLPSTAAWELESFTSVSGTGGPPTASICLSHRDGRRLMESSFGDGPVDAVFKAIEKLTGVSAKLLSYRISSISHGEDAQGQAIVEVEHDGQTYRGIGLSTDIIEASARAYLTTINRIASGATVVVPLARERGAV